MGNRILLFDIEIIPRSFGDPWQTMSASPERSTLCSFGYKEQTEKKAHVIGLDNWETTFFKDPYNEEALVKAAHNILANADGLVAHYGDKFDVKYMRTKFLIYGLDYQVLNSPTRDTCLIARKKLKLHSNRLNELAKILGLPLKDKMQMRDWFDIIGKDISKMKKMDKYCAQDVQVLHEVYKKLCHLFPQGKWPHAGIAEGGVKEDCPLCASTHTWFYGWSAKTTGKYHKQQCQECGHVWPGRKMLEEELRLN